LAHRRNPLIPRLGRTGAKAYDDLGAKRRLKPAATSHAKTRADLRLPQRRNPLIPRLGAKTQAKACDYHVGEARRLTASRRWNR